MNVPHSSDVGVYSDLALGMKLFAKKGDDIWYKGTLVDILNLHRSLSEVRLAFWQFYRFACFSFSHDPDSLSPSVPAGTG